MEFYFFRALFPALPIDLWLTIVSLKKGRNAIGAFLPVPFYFVCTWIWAAILSASNPAFQGQGVIGLAFLMGIGIALSIVRFILGLLLFLNHIWSKKK